MLPPKEYQRLRNALSDCIGRVQAARHNVVGGADDPSWPEWYAHAMVEDLRHLLPRAWTLQTIAAELRRAEAERQTQQPGMNPAKYYAEWLLVRVERDEIP
jgi:hypothetical protein